MLKPSPSKLRNDLDRPARYVRATFAFTKQTLSNPVLVSQPGGIPQPKHLAADGNEIEIDWGERLIEPCAEVAIEVESDHSPILCTHQAWSAEQQSLLIDQPLSDDLDLVGEPLLAEDPCAQEEGPGKGKSCKDFFKEYDRRFLPSDVKNNQNMTTEEQEERGKVVGRMVKLLIQRRDARAKAAKRGKTPDPKSLPGREQKQRNDIRHLSEAQKELYRECFPNGKDGIDYKKFQECFEQFANGELRNSEKPGDREPDGGYFFLFAEFAFLAIAVAENPAVWKRLLRTFVKCQEIFIDVYRPAGGEIPRLDDYKAKNFRKDGQADDVKKKKLRKKYKDMSPGQLERAAADNMKRAQAAKRTEQNFV